MVWPLVTEDRDRLDVISDDKTARLFGDHIVEASRAFADSTSISAGIDLAMTQLDRAPYQTSRRAIDVSGDGDNNSGRDVTAARDEAIAKDVTINGLVIDCPADLGTIHVDQTRLRQSLLNLASNANKFTEKGTVTIAAYQGQENGRDWITLAVTDTGIGMTPQQMGKLVPGVLPGFTVVGILCHE